MSNYFTQYSHSLKKFSCAHHAFPPIPFLMCILCVSTLKNEGPFLIEWLAHLMGASVTDFLL